MPVLVYITKECQKDAKEHNFLGQVQTFAERILREQRVTLFDNFPPPYLKKRFLRQLRLIAAERHIGENVVVCFYRMFVRGNRDYDLFLGDPREYGDQHLAPLVSDDVLVKWVDQQLQETPPPEKDPPSDAERGYLWNVLDAAQMTGKEVFVCESGDWVEAVKDKSLVNILLRFLDGIMVLTNGKAGGSALLTPVPRANDWQIMSRWFPDQRKLFLVAPVQSGSSDKIEAYQKKYGPVLDVPESEVTEEQLLRYCVRTYPEDLLLSENSWLMAQRDDAANLALSPEETAVLESVHKLAAGKEPIGFPLFINGRAGSGKSTILQYLYSDYLQHYLSTEINSDSNGPLYLTCSVQLLERCRSVVESILECSARYQYKKERVDEATLRRIKQVSGTCFKEFHKFLTELLPADERTDQFHPNKYVDYPRFKEVWREKFAADKDARKSYPADTCWHVIRTYIKGLSIDDYIDVEEYSGLPKDEKSVSLETFKVIYDRVWTSWYKAQNENGLLWDDQDLVRHVLSKGLLKASFPAVFADEAQDFTRIELEALFRLCVFSERKLSPQELARVPFAFAGDPFQTLNPTGFRWDAIKSAFVTKFVMALDPARLSQVKDLNYRVLDFNYRSTANVVKLCNTIQALRMVLFGITGIKPQTTWQQEESSPAPVWFERGDPQVLKALPEQGDVTIIVPCEEGEEAQYVREDSFLRTVIKVDEDGTPRNVLSAMRSKGLEFNRVVIYGFGSLNCPARLLEAAETPVEISREEQLTWEYYVNRLYVACSRARRRLYVIDSQEGLQRLWKLCTDTDLQDKLLGRIKADRDLWKDGVGVLQRGTPESWTTDGDDIAQLAERYEQDGKAKRDPYLLRQAALSFHAIQQERRAQLCKALAYRYERQFKKSGDLYAQIEAYDEAMLSFWAGKEYAAISILCEKSRPLAQKLEARFADFFARQPNVPAGERILTEFAQGLNDESFRADKLGDGTWLDAVSCVIDEVVERLPSKDFSAEWGKIEAAVKTIAKAGIRISAGNRARVAYAVCDVTAALNFWREAGETTDPLYRQTVQRMAMNTVREGRKGELSPEDIASAIQGFIIEGAYGEARKLYREARDADGLVRLLQMTGVRKDSSTAISIFQDLIECFWEKGAWQDLVAFARDEMLPALDPDSKAVFKKTILQNPWQIRGAYIRQCALSDMLADAENRSVKQPLSDYLKKIFIEGGGGWADYITPEVAGAALERAGRDIDCLAFYERVIADARFNEEQRRRASIRWVSCKFKQAKREEAAGQKSKRARDHAREAGDRMRGWSIAEIETQAEYPDVSSFQVVGSRSEKGVPGESKGNPPAHGTTQPLVSPVVKPTPAPAVVSLSVQFRLCDLEFVYSDEGGGRLNVTRGTETLALRIAKKQCVSVDFDVESPEVGRFLCPALALELDVRPVATASHMLITVGPMSLKLQVSA